MANLLQETRAHLRSAQQLRRRFDAALLLNQAQEAWQCALVLKSAEAWRALAAHAMHTMDVQLAIRQAWANLLTATIADRLPVAALHRMWSTKHNC